MRILKILCVAAISFVLFYDVQAQDAGWTRMPGLAADIAINTDGQAYVVAPDGTPWRWDKVEQRWRRMSGNFVRITAAEGNRPWALNADGVVYRYNGLWWEDKATDVVDVAADTKGNVYIAKTDGKIFKWYALRSEWRPFEGAAKRLVVDTIGQPWAIGLDGVIRNFDGKAWQAYPGRARDIGLGGTDVVMIADMAGLLRSWDGKAKRWAVIEGVKDVIAVGVTPEGVPWVAVEGGAIWAAGGLVADEGTQEDSASDPKPDVPQAPTSVANVESPSVPTPTTPSAPVPQATSMASKGDVEQGGTGGTPTNVAADPVTITTKEKITFINTLKSAATLAIGADGSVFALDSGGNVLRWSNTKKKFDTFPGTLVRIAVDKDGHPWGISALGRVFRHTGTQWKQIPNITAVDIAIGYDSTVIVANAAGRLYKLNSAQTRFESITGSGVAVAVAPDGAPWTIRSDKLLQRCDVSPCQVMAQKALSLSIGPDGSVWIVSDRNFLMRLKADGTKFEVVPTPGHTPWKVAVGPSGYPWVVSDARLALASNFFPRDENRDVSVAAATSGDTSGTGATTTVTSSSTSSFTFSKNMQFETVSYSTLNSSQYAVLASDIDGVIWATTQGGAIDKYSAAQKKFIDAKTKFTSDNYDISAFDIAPNGDIWAYTLNPSTGLFRERNKVLKQYTVSGLTAGNVAVSPDGTVYADFYTGGTHYIFAKAPDSEVFKKLKQAYGYGIAVGPGNDLWIVQGDNYVYQWTGSTFQKRPASGQKASKIAVSKTDGTVYIINTSNALMKWNSTNKSFDKVNNVTGYYIAVDDQGRPWINTDNTPTIKRGED